MKMLRKKFSKTYGPTEVEPLSEGPRILASKPVRAMLGALQTIRDRKLLDKKRRW